MRRPLAYAVPAVVATVMAGWAPAAPAEDVPQANDPAAQAIDTQIGEAVAAQQLIGVKSKFPLEPGSSRTMAVDGAFNMKRPSFRGTLKVASLPRISIWSTPSRTLGRLAGAPCWKASKEFSFTAIGTVTLGLADPRAWIDKTTTGPAVYSLAGPGQLRWTLGGKTSVAALETYDPATMLPTNTEIVQQAAAGESNVSVSYRFTGLAAAAAQPKSLRICKKKKA